MDQSYRGKRTLREGRSFEEPVLQYTRNTSLGAVHLRVGGVVETRVKQTAFLPLPTRNSFYFVYAFFFHVETCLKGQAATRLAQRQDSDPASNLGLFWDLALVARESLTLCTIHRCVWISHERVYEIQQPFLSRTFSLVLCE